mgnify:CR=1 FL=1
MTLGVNRPRAAALLLAALVVLMGLPACALRRPDPVLKIGLLAPFEGARRQQGYHLLPAIRAATPELVQGRRVEWVILDTQGDPDIAAQRARELLVDPAVLAIVGPLLPATVEAVAPVIAGGEIAWWPLAPEGEEGVARWLGRALPAEQGGWGAASWLAIRRGELERYFDPDLPPALGPFAAVAGDQPWPQDWLAWRATQAAFAAMEAAPDLSRARVRASAEPLEWPKAVEYSSTDLVFPGTVQPAR